ncbi:MAG: hypothetical protein ACPGVA_02170 [Pikeienuella sp.]
MGVNEVLNFALAVFGLIGWMSVWAVVRSPNAQGRRARLIGINLCVFAFVATLLALSEPGTTDLRFYLYVHAAAVTALDLAIVRWRRWRIWSGLRFEQSDLDRRPQRVMRRGKTSAR